MGNERPEFSHPIFNDPEACREALNNPVITESKVPAWLREAQEEADHLLEQAKLEAEKTAAAELSQIRKELSQ